MRKLALISFILFTGCASSQPVISACPACPEPIVKHDTLFQVVSVPTNIHDTSVVMIPLPAQQGQVVFELNIPPSGDDYLALQANIDTAIARGYKQIHFNGGPYHISHGLDFLNTSGAFLEGIHLYGDQGTYGIPILTVTNGATYGINFVRAKGCRIEGIIIQGVNTGLNAYSVQQVLSGDSSSFTTNGAVDNNATPHAGFVVDGVGYPGLETWKAQTYGNGGSTDIIFRNCRAQYFTVDYCLSPGGFLQNDEAITIEDCWGDYAKAAISTGESQQRSVFVKNFKCWGWVNTVFDCRDYGNGESCPPIVTGLNVAGCARYLCRLGQWNSQGLIIRDAHIESLWSLGGCPDGPSNQLSLYTSFVSFIGQKGAIMPPASVFQGYKLLADNCFLWQYGADVYTPLHFTAPVADFRGVTFDFMPVDDYNLATPAMLFSDCMAGGKLFGY